MGDARKKGPKGIHIQREMNILAYDPNGNTQEYMVNDVSYVTHVEEGGIEFVTLKITVERELEEE